ncbi:MAG: dihydrolipoamide acetyltransferase family protein [Phycisphaerae bacterium]
MPREFRLPDLGEGIIEAQVVQVLIKEGETISEDQGLFEVETDKAAVEIPSPFAGLVAKIHVTAGQTVNVGDVMVTLDGDGQTGAAPAATEQARAVSTSASASVSASTSPASAAPPAAAPGGKRYIAAAAPAVRKLARELGLDLDTIAGSGPGGRVTKADVESAKSGQPPTARAAAPLASSALAAPVGAADTEKWGPVRRVKMTQIRKTIAQQMMRSVSSIAHVTHIDTVDVTEMEALRRQYKETYEGQHRITAMVLIIKAVAKTLLNHPIFNAGIDMDAGEIIYKDYINVGVAVDTERGLVVPKIRNADRLSILQIADALAAIAEKARDAQFSIEDLRGGTFSITNVGAVGGTFSTPIINYPEVAILALGQSRPTPVVREGQIVVRTVMPVSLSFDHRIADGAQAARFCHELLGCLETPVKLLI